MRHDLLFIGFCLLALTGVAVALVYYRGPSLLMAAAKIWAYGTAAGRAEYARRHDPETREDFPDAP